MLPNHFRPDLGRMGWFRDFLAWHDDELIYDHGRVEAWPMAGEHLLKIGGGRWGS